MADAALAEIEALKLDNRHLLTCLNAANEEAEAALARAEAAERERADAEAVSEKAFVIVVEQRDAALARIRVLEEGLRDAIAGFDRIADEIDEGAGGVDWSDEVRAEATELRAILSPAKEDGK